MSCQICKWPPVRVATKIKRRKEGREAKLNAPQARFVEQWRGACACRNVCCVDMPMKQGQIRHGMDSRPLSAGTQTLQPGILAHAHNWRRSEDRSFPAHKLIKGMRGIASGRMEGLHTPGASRSTALLLQSEPITKNSICTFKRCL